MLHSSNNRGNCVPSHAGFCSMSTSERRSDLAPAGGPLRASLSAASLSADGSPSDSEATSATPPKVEPDVAGTGGSASGGGASTAVRPRRSDPRVDQLPPWNVLLHDDDESDMLFVVDTIVVLGVANRPDAIVRMLEAHETGCALLTTTHRERAELWAEQFASKGLTVTIEPAER